MAFNGSGTHSRVHDWTTDLANTVPVTASRMDAEHDDISTALSTTICRDGQSTTTARIPFAQGTSASGSATSSVAYSQTGDVNTGVYFPAADQYGLVAGGTATITSTSAAVTVTATLTVTGAADFGGAAIPTNSDGGALGSATKMWSDLFLASGAVINFNNGDVTVTHSANTLAFAGASSGYTFDAAPLPASDDGAAIGSTAAKWSDMFLASGAVVNWNSGDVTLTHSANALAFAGATSGYSFDTSVTVGSGFTVSAGSVSLPAASVADAALTTPGAWKLIETITANNDANIDFDASLDSTYDAYMIVGSSIKVGTDDVSYNLRVQTAGGWQADATDYGWSNLANLYGGTAITNDNSDSEITLTNESATFKIGSASGECLNFVIQFNDPDAAILHNFHWNGVYNRALDSLPIQFDGAGYYTGVEAITGVRFFAGGSANTASGTFSLYGLKK